MAESVAHAVKPGTDRKFEVIRLTQGRKKAGAHWRLKSAQEFAVGETSWTMRGMLDSVKLFSF